MHPQLNPSDVEAIESRRPLPPLDAEANLRSPAHPTRLRPAPTPPLRTIFVVLAAAGLLLAGYLALWPGTSKALHSVPVTAVPSNRADQGPRWTAHRFFDELHTQGNLAVAHEIVAPDAIFHIPGDDLVGPEGISGLVTALRSAFPDAVFPIEDMVGDGDVVAVRWSMRGTFRGEFQGIAPTGAEVTTTGTAFLRIRDGLIVEDWVEYDLNGLLGQLTAAAPAADQPPSGINPRDIGPRPL